MKPQLKYRRKESSKQQKLHVRLTDRIGLRGHIHDPVWIPEDAESRASVGIPKRIHRHRCLWRLLWLLKARSGERSDYLCKGWIHARRCFADALKALSKKITRLQKIRSPKKQSNGLEQFIIWTTSWQIWNWTTAGTSGKLTQSLPLFWIIFWQWWKIIRNI